MAPATVHASDSANYRHCACYKFLLRYVVLWKSLISYWYITVVTVDSILTLKQKTCQEYHGLLTAECCVSGSHVCRLSLLYWSVCDFSVVALFARQLELVVVNSENSFTIKVNLVSVLQ